MNSCDDEPRKHPIPVPFCNEIVAKPSVPEVSLISVEDTNSESGKKNDFFCGTQFQTYNAWRWKYMNEVDKNSSSGEKFRVDKCPSTDNCVLIKDKYSSMEAEKRKNEILYGQMEEPRQPLMPKSFPEIPKLNDSFPMSNSFEDIVLNDNNKSKALKKSCGYSKPEMMFGKTDNEFLSVCLKKNLDGSKKLYNLISEQNKQIEILHQQMEQILRLQDVKDKQIGQLLKTQESKEKKIEKLLLSVEGKNNEIEKLLEIKEKQEQCISVLSKSHDEIKSQNMELLKKLDDLSKKETNSVSTMTEINPVNDFSTHKSLTGASDSSSSKKMDDSSCLRNGSELNEFPKEDKSLSLHSLDLPVIQDHPSSPQSSIHLDIQDFRYSSEESDSEPETTQSCLPFKEINSNQLGYTFYNNIMTQVKDIIQNSGDKENKLGSMTDSISGKNGITKGIKNSFQSFKNCEVFETENVQQSPVLNTGPHFYKRLPFEPPNYFQKETYSPSDISLKINSLALKYLKQEQLSQYNLESQIPISRHPDVTIYNVTNLSFGSTRMDKYNLMPSMKEQLQVEGKIQTNCGYTRRRKKVLNEIVMPEDKIIEMN